MDPIDEITEGILIEDRFGDAAARRPFIVLLHQARDAMRATGDPRWRAVANLLDDEATRIVDVEYRIGPDWIERNQRTVLAVARAYLEESR